MRSALMETGVKEMTATVAPLGAPASPCGADVPRTGGGCQGARRPALPGPAAQPLSGSCGAWPEARAVTSWHGAPVHLLEPRGESVGRLGLLAVLLAPAPSIQHGQLPETRPPAPQVGEVLLRAAGPGIDGAQGGHGGVRALKGVGLERVVGRHREVLICLLHLPADVVSEHGEVQVWTLHPLREGMELGSWVAARAPLSWPATSVTAFDLTEVVETAQG